MREISLPFAFDIVAPEFHERVRTRTRIVIEEKRGDRTEGSPLEKI